MGNNNKQGKGNPLSNPQGMERYAIKVFRDLAFGNLTPDKARELFTNIQFRKNALKACYDKLMETSVYIESIKIAYPYMNQYNAYITKVYNDNYKTMEAYRIIYNALSYIENYNDTGYVLIMANHLSKYKHNI